MTKGCPPYPVPRSVNFLEAFGFNLGFGHTWKLWKLTRRMKKGRPGNVVNFFITFFWFSIYLLIVFFCCNDFFENVDDRISISSSRGLLTGGAIIGAAEPWYTHYLTPALHFFNSHNCISQILSKVFLSFCKLHFSDFTNCNVSNSGDCFIGTDESL